MTKVTYAALALAVGSFGIVGCDQGDSSTPSTTTTTTTTTTDPSRTTTTGPSVGTQIDNAASNAAANMKEAGRDAGAALNKAGEKTGDALNNAGEKMDNAVDRAGEKINNAAEKTGDAAKDATDATRDAAKDATDTTRDAAKDARSSADPAAPGADGAVLSSGTVAASGTAAAPDAEGVRNVIAQVTNASLTKGGFDDLVERLVDADRNRVGNLAEQDMPELDGLIDQIGKDWKAKYNADFKVDGGEAGVFPASVMTVTQSEVPAAGSGLTARPRLLGDAAGADNKTAVDSPGTGAADTNRNDPGRNLATVRLKGSGGMSDLEVPLIHEFPAVWKIDVPDTVDGPKLKQNLMDHLTMVKDMKAQWPADAKEAQRAVAHHVLMALMDKPVK